MQTQVIFFLITFPVLLILQILRHLGYLHRKAIGMLVIFYLLAYSLVLYTTQEHWQSQLLSLLMLYGFTLAFFAIDICADVKDSS